MTKYDVQEMHVRLYQEVTMIQQEHGRVTLLILKAVLWCVQTLMQMLDERNPDA